MTTHVTLVASPNRVADFTESATCPDCRRAMYLKLAWIGRAVACFHCRAWI